MHSAQVDCCNVELLPLDWNSFINKGRPPFCYPSLAVDASTLPGPEQSKSINKFHKYSMPLCLFSLRENQVGKVHFWLILWVTGFLKIINFKALPIWRPWSGVFPRRSRCHLFCDSLASIPFGASHKMKTWNVCQNAFRLGWWTKINCPTILINKARKWHAPSLAFLTQLAAGRNVWEYIRFNLANINKIRNWTEMHNFADDLGRGQAELLSQGCEEGMRGLKPHPDCCNRVQLSCKYTCATSSPSTSTACLSSITCHPLVDRVARLPG